MKVGRFSETCTPIAPPLQGDGYAGRGWAVDLRVMRDFALFSDLDGALIDSN
jgi:hypothetical protein